MTEARVPKSIILKKLKKCFSRKFRRRLRQAANLEELLKRIEKKQGKLAGKLAAEKDKENRKILNIQLAVLTKQQKKAEAMKDKLKAE